MTVGLADIEAAARRLRGKAVLTPLIESPALNGRSGPRTGEGESLQRAGAFKFRGAYNRLSQLEAAQRRRGVVAYSSGNHAQGVALAARLLGVPALIVMPSNAPAVKIEGTRLLGAEVIFYDRARDSRESIAEALAREREAVIVPAYDDATSSPAGDGGTGDRAAGQRSRDNSGSCYRSGRRRRPDGGVSMAIKALSPATGVWGVEPVGSKTRASPSPPANAFAPRRTRARCVTPLRRRCPASSPSLSFSAISKAWLR